MAWQYLKGMILSREKPVFESLKIMEFSEQLAQATEAVSIIAGIKVKGHLVRKGIILREFGAR